MAGGNPFFGIELATLTTIKTNTLSALTAVLSNQSYSLEGKSVSRADLDKIKDTLGQVQAAIDVANNDAETLTRVSFTGI